MSLKVSIAQWMIFNLHGEPLNRWVERQAFGHRPALQYAIYFQTEVIMQATGRVFLDKE
jgi:hypothetical protein